MDVFLVTKNFSATDGCIQFLKYDRDIFIVRLYCACIVIMVMLRVNSAE